MTRVQGVRLQNNIAIVLQHKYGYALGGCMAAEEKKAGGITWRASWACLPDKIYFLQDNGIHFVWGSEGSPLVIITRNFLQKENTLF
jgi:hypothetical protein